MKELNNDEVRSQASASDVIVPEEELALVTIRLNGFLELLKPLETLPLDNVEIIPTLPTQRED